MSKLLEELKVDLEDLVLHINQAVEREVKAQMAIFIREFRENEISETARQLRDAKILRSYKSDRI